METKQNTIIELTVQNHAGVMSHITGLFSRRGYNLEGILCGRIGDGTQSKMYLMVERNQQFEQVIKQLNKLYDVMAINILDEADVSIFNRMDELLSKAS